MPQEPRLALLAVAASLALFLVVGAPAPLARADEVPQGSGAYYHVGDNLWRANASGLLGVAAALDGNASSGVPLFSISPGTNQYPACSSATGNNVTLPLSPVVADMVHVAFLATMSGSGNGGGSCIAMGLTLTNGAYYALKPFSSECGPCTYTSDAWYNVSLPAGVSANGVYVTIASICSPCGSYSKSATILEAEAFQKDATLSDPVRAIADLAAANLQCYATGAAYANFSSHAYTMPLGTYYVMVPAVMPAASTSPPNSMQISTTFSSVVTSTFYGWSRVLPDITGAHHGAVAIWRVTTAEAGIPVYVKPSGTGDINATDTVCTFARVGAMYSSTLANGYVTAPLASWGGTSTDLWGVVYDSLGYPVNSVYEVDLSGTGPLFKQDNMTFGAQAFPTGTAGQATTLSLAAQPFTWAGNGILLALGQSTSAQGASSSYEILVDGKPAQAVANGASTTHAFQYALFYVDDVAARNGLDNEGGTYGQSAFRPLSAESYEITLVAGFDAAAPVYFGNTYGRDGHAALTCLTLCGANLAAQELVIPSKLTNAVRFYVHDEDGAPLEGVRIQMTSTLSTRFTDAEGNAAFVDLFTTARFDIYKADHQQLCAEYRFRTSSGAQTGTTSEGCPYIAAFNATFTVKLASLDSLGSGGEGSISIGGGSTQHGAGFTFEGNFTRLVPDQVSISVQRNATGDHLVTVLKRDVITGTYAIVAGPTSWPRTAANRATYTFPGAATTTDDVGTYALMVSTGQTYLADASFFIVATWGAPVDDYGTLKAQGLHQEAAVLAGSTYTAAQAAAYAEGLAASAAALDVGGALANAAVYIPLILVILLAGVIIRNWW